MLQFQLWQLSDFHFKDYWDFLTNYIYEYVERALSGTEVGLQGIYPPPSNLLDGKSGEANTWNFLIQAKVL